MACRVEQIAGVGDFYEYELPGNSVAIVRTRDGLRAYQNACRHRGTRLCVGSGRIGEFFCPFHGWRWHLDGSLKDRFKGEDFEPRSEADLNLQPVNVDTWGGWVFINLDNHAEPLLEFLSPLPKLFAPYKLDHMRLRWFRSTIIECNWKTSLDAFREAYHAPTAHPHLYRAEWRRGTPTTLEEARTWEKSTTSVSGAYGLHARVDSISWSEDRAEVLRDSGRIDERPRASAYVGPQNFERFKQEGGGFDLEGMIDFLEYMYFEDLKSMLAELDLRALRRMRDIPVPAGVEPFDHFVVLRRELARAEGMDWHDLTADEVDAASYMWSVFPNMVVLAYQGTLLGYRARPNGLDPDSCIFDAWSMEQAPVSQLGERTDVAPELITPWQEHAEEFGLVFMQDFANMPRVTAGLHTPGFAGHSLSSVAEVGVFHQHAAADRYLWE
jgi:nitrite reductase/ring-hydroxylating ferredoxin subunit